VITGEFYWKVKRSNVIPAGSRAGSDRPDGYRWVKIDFHPYNVQRLAWMYVTGEDPGELQVDHIDRDKGNNAWHNLRLADGVQQQGNRGPSSNGTTGYRGVCFHKRKKRYQALLMHEGKRYYLGLHDTPEEAHAAYCRASAELRGEFHRAA
jgi:predicted RNA-binding protein associated with RNAse of E/G family